MEVPVYTRHSLGSLGEVSVRVALMGGSAIAIGSTGRGVQLNDAIGGLGGVNRDNRRHSEGGRGLTGLSMVDWWGGSVSGYGMSLGCPGDCCVSCSTRVRASKSPIYQPNHVRHSANPWSNTSVDNKKRPLTTCSKVGMCWLLGRMSRL